MCDLRAILAQSAPSPLSSPGDLYPFTGSPLHFPWHQWIDIHDWTIAARSASTLVLLLLLSLLLSRIFRSLLVKYELLRNSRQLSRRRVGECCGGLGT